MNKRKIKKAFDHLNCNQPKRTPGENKSWIVKGCQDGEEKIVRFGDPNMKDRSNNPDRRRSFRARHKCDEAKDKTSARYWSCKKW